MTTTARTAAAPPPVVDRATFEEQVAALRVREKAHTREGSGIAAERRALPMVEVDATARLDGPDGPVTLLDAFDGRSQLLAYFFMWEDGLPHEDQCEGCTFYTSQVRELSYLHSHDITFAVLSQGPYDQTAAYRDFMGWTMPWYSSLPSREQLLTGRAVGMFHLINYLRDGDRVFETFWTNGRGVEAMDNSYALMDLTPYGRQEAWEASPPGRPQPWAVDPVSLSTNGRPTAQLSRTCCG